MVGIDIVDTKRIEKILTLYGERFLRRILSDEERKYVDRKKRRIESISGIFAAKEAFIKAMEKRIPLREIRVLNENGKPYIVYNGRFFKNVSISHEKTYAISLVIVP
ncbi:MAG: holo-ACP synthase [Desulfobacterota bacterium]|nr:holo-ACP synthase [Thermodesulfobacteriota bacterium]MDW8002261.1 holo-ACP synthase [Deltaproteobacteria bacterium]